MLTSLRSSNFLKRKIPSYRRRLRGFRLALIGLLPLAALALIGCDDEAPHYLPPLPDLAGAESTAGVPCAVSQLVADRCIACHGQQPISGQKLVSYAELTAMSPVEPGKKIAERMITRIQSPANPMPPTGPTVPASELMPLADWVAAGTPMTTCTK